MICASGLVSHNRMRRRFGQKGDEMAKPVESARPLVAYASSLLASCSPNTYVFTTNLICITKVA